MRLVTPLAFAVLVAGCADAGTTVDITGEPGADGRLDAGEFWMVWVEGEEGPAQSNIACSIIFDHIINASARTIRYNAKAYHWAPDEVQVLVVFDVFSRGSGCPEAFALHNEWSSREDTKAWGDLEVAVAADGTVTLRGTAIAPGELATFRTTDGGDPAVLRVHAYGAWPQSALKPGP